MAQHCPRDHSYYDECAENTPVAYVQSRGQKSDSMYDVSVKEKK